MKFNKIILTLIVLITFLSIPTAVWATDGGLIIRVGQDITVLEDERYDTIIGIGNTIKIDGTVLDAVIAVGGNIEVNGHIGDAIILIGSNAHIKNDLPGDVIVIGTNITIEPNVIIGGDIVLIGGQIMKGEHVAIHGSQVEITAGDLLYNIGVWGPPILGIFFGVLLVGSLVFALLTFLSGLLFPTGIERSRKYVMIYPGQTFLVGLLLFIFFIPINFILLISIIGITLLPLLWLIYGVLAIWGISVIAKIIGLKVLNAFNYQGSSEVLPLLIGIFAFYLLAFIPVIGWFILLLIKIMALGISILTHLGFKEENEAIQ